MKNNKIYRLERAENGIFYVYRALNCAYKCNKIKILYRDGTKLQTSRNLQKKKNEHSL